MRGLALGGEQQALCVERLALHPRGETGRGDEVVDLHRELEALFRGEERLEVESTQLVE